MTVAGPGIHLRSLVEGIVWKYSLATMHVNIDGKPRDFAHVIVIPHVSLEVLAEFLNDLECGPFKSTAKLSGKE